MLTLVKSIHLSFDNSTIEFDHYAGECEFGILKKKTKKKTHTHKKKEKAFGCAFLLNGECPKTPQ